MSTRFVIGDRYTKDDIYRLVGVAEERRYGAWDTGYREYEGNRFVFANVGIPGRTGHDYANRWVTSDTGGEDLEWQGKTTSRLDHPLSQALLSRSGETLIFWRSDDRAGFTFAGAGVPLHVNDTVPIGVTWRFHGAPSQYEVEAGLIEVCSRSRADGGQGIRVSAAEARCIELRAMAVAVELLEAEGWHVDDVSRYRPYDLHCTSGAQVLHVEVKGTKTAGATIILTANEVAFVRAHPEDMALFVVSEVRTELADGSWRADGGRATSLRPWNLSAERLSPIAFRYEL